MERHLISRYFKPPSSVKGNMVEQGANLLRKVEVYFGEAASSSGPKMELATTQSTATRTSTLEAVERARASL
jgi:hypothetical protein|eukprot:CAMPEP_0168607706 /NCGR_PEP_ID=MMETSP0449_2-20121227/204_1 /TAXON_ID=1082188 /ORGANISM="Strombidium rassoulzadegani, Strain ras09" /LENGTH=71 /DNA_ID=CAMNT_0008647577 /DNA_START=221 /DNA_END=436 /DNA_ORIENTATION=-